MGINLEKFKAAIVKAGQLKALTDPIQVESHMPELEEVLDKLHDVFGDGFQWSDIGDFIGEVVPEFMDVAKKFKEESGEDKKKFVVDAVVATYFYYDPDLPWIPEWIEVKLEKWAVPQLASAAIEAAYKFGKKRGYWDDEQADDGPADPAAPADPDDPAEPTPDPEPAADDTEPTDATSDGD